MASRRKKSRPTKIAEFEPLIDIEQNSVDQAFFDQEAIEDDQAARIKRFLEEESEDTPENSFEQIKQSPVKKILGNPDKSTVSSTLDIVEAVEAVTKHFTNSYPNGTIPANLRFHQLTSDDDTIDYTIQAQSHGMTNGTALRQPLKGLGRKKTGESMQKHSTHYKYLLALSMPGVKRGPAKRSRVRDEDCPRYTCETCKYVTNRSDHFKRHQMTHSADKPLKCHKCSYGTGRSDHYKRHLQRHGMSEKDIIDCCARNGLKLKNIPSNNTNVKSANKTTQDNNTKPPALVVKKEPVPEIKYIPEKVTFLDPGATPPNTILDGGDELSSDSKRFECSKCEYTTNKKSHFTRHQLGHTKNTFTSCAKCNKSFKTTSYLHRHRCKPQRRCAQCKQIFINHEAMLLHTAQEHPDTPQFVVTKNEFSETEAELDLCLLNGTFSDQNQIEYAVNETEDNTADMTEPMDLSKCKSEKQDEKTLIFDVQVPNREKLDMPTQSISSETKITVVGTGPLEDTVPHYVPLQKQTVSMQSDLTAMGNFRCTKCSAWFNKLNEYSAHQCI
uniref:zinc finger protein 260-like n=1 Tax=Styela clava TaxID=7725 RepID=UPI00193A25B2|nr:zinc finger protein 260-like [Styela clava]